MVGDESDAGQRRRLACRRSLHKFKSLKADEVLAPPERRQPAESEPMGCNVVATTYVADHKTEAGLQSSLKHQNMLFVKVIVDRGGVIELREDESLGKVLSNVSRQGMAEKAKVVERGEDPTSHKLGMRLPIEGVGEANIEAASLNRIRERTAINNDTRNGGEVKLTCISLAAHNEDLCLARIKGQAIRSGPICDRLGISSYAIECEMKIRRRKVVIELRIVGKIIIFEKWTTDGRSLMKIAKRSGPRTLPCETPEASRSHSKILPPASMTT